MADTGWKNPSAEGKNHSEWFYATNVYLSDNNAAITWKNTSCDQQDYYEFGLSVPAGVTIDGIEVSVEAKRVSTFADDFTINVQLSWNGGSSWTDAKQNTWTTTTDTYKSYGGSSDTWGRGWSSDDFSDVNFVAYFYLSAGDTTGFAHEVDHIRIKVYYTESQGSDHTATVSDVVSLDDGVSTQTNYKKTLTA